MTAEGLKALYETQLRDEVDSLGLGSEERQGLWQLLSASRRMHPGELREQEQPGVWLWSDLHLGHAMTLSVFGRPYWTPEEMDDALFEAWRQVVDPADTVVILGDIAIGGLSGHDPRRPRSPTQAGSSIVPSPSRIEGRPFVAAAASLVGVIIGTTAVADGPWGRRVATDRASRWRPTASRRVEGRRGTHQRGESTFAT